MKQGFQFRVSTYSTLASLAAITFGVVMGSGLYIFMGLALLLVAFLGNKHN